ncbi:MAG: hypothetical protein FJ121_12635 [Deltaproteobacteria bacterium]|nr:hypothetical protein [Deltaproteobacteria bacterium]
MPKKLALILRLGLLLLVSAALLSGGCATVDSMKKWAGYGTKDEDEETAPPEAQQETVMIDGKPYVRSKNPYWLTYPNTPEYLYVEKGTEFVGAQQHLLNSLAKAMGREQAKAAGKTIPPDKLQEMVRAEVDRILREQGLGGFVSQGPGASGSAVVGRAVAVIPALDTPRSYDGLNRTLAMALGNAMGKTKDLKVSAPESVQEALRKAEVAGKLTLAPNIKALGDALGVQGIVLTGIMPPEGGTQGAMVLQVYDTFTGLQENAIVAPGGAGGLKPQDVTKFAQDNALRVAGDLTRIAWFGRVEFVKEGKVYLSLGQNSGLKVGDRLKVVEPGKAVVNPKTHSVLGYTADNPQGEIKVTELLGNSGAVGLALSGGPFKANDKVKAAK